MANKVVVDIFNLAERKGYQVAKSNRGITTITTDEGFVFEHILSGGQSKIRRLHPPPAETPSDHVDRTGRAGSGMLSFSNKDSGRRFKNILRELRNMGLDLDIRPKRTDGDVTEAEAEAEAEATPQSGLAQKTPTARAVDEILESPSTVEDLLHSAVLASALEGSCPIHEIDGKTFMDWTGDIIEILKPGWPEIDVTDIKAMARLESGLVEGYLRRGYRIFRVHQYSDGTAVWRVRVPPEVELTSDQPKAEEARADVTKKQGEEAGGKAKGETVKEPHRCKICPFVGTSAHALTMHKTQMRGKQHNAQMTALRCPQCQAVRTTHLTLQTHLRRDHDVEYLCKICAEEGKVVWFSQGETYKQHGVAAHDVKIPRPRYKAKTESQEEPAEPEEAVAVTAEEPKAPQASPSAPETPLAAEAAKKPQGDSLEPSSALSGRVVLTGTPDEAMEQAVIAMMRSVPELRAANAALEAEVEKERKLRLSAEEELERVSKKLRRITSAQAELFKALED